MKWIKKLLGKYRVKKLRKQRLKKIKKADPFIYD